MSNTVINPYNFAVASVGAWKELGRTTLTGVNSAIDVSGLSNKMYYMFLCDFKSAVNAEPSLRINADSGSNYARRASTDGAADATGINQDQFYNFNQSLNGNEGFTMGYISNLVTKEKLLQWNWVTNRTGTGAGTAPNRQEAVGKWVNTSSSLSAFNTFDSSGDNFSVGSEVVVLGYDPTDTHTEADNFWQELASVDLSGGASPTLDSGVFTAKKYLWFQFYCDSIASTATIRCTFNSDTGGNYANRINYNGTEDPSNVNTGYAILAGSTYTTPFFVNMFVINNSANEKLITGNTVQQGAAGAANAPAQRIAVADKWANTSSQITSIQIINNAAANFGTTTYLRVWGSD